MVFQFEHDNLDTLDGERWAYRKVPLPELKAVLSKWQTQMNGKAWNSLYWTNHDQPRTVSRRGNDGKYRKESQKMLYTMLMTMQGTPYIYQGEEIGMTNVAFDSIEEGLFHRDSKFYGIVSSLFIRGTKSALTDSPFLKFRHQREAHPQMSLR